MYVVLFIGLLALKRSCRTRVETFVIDAMPWVTIFKALRLNEMETQIRNSLNMASAQGHFQRALEEYERPLADGS